MKILRKITAVAMSLAMVASVFGAFNLTTASAATQSTQYTGKPITPKIALYDNDGTELTEGVDFDFDYENNVNVGTAYIIVTFKGNYDGEQRIPFEITPRAVTAEKTEIGEIASQTYTGDAIKPVTTVKYNNKELVYDTDYDFSYENNENVGTATVNVNFKGNYTGTLPTTFTITAKALTQDDVTIAPVADVVYTGQPLTPEPVIKVGDKTLEKDKDYTLIYKDNTEKGTGNIQIDFISNYIGQVGTTFRIVEKVLTADDVVISDIPEQEYTGNPIEPKVEVKYGDTTLTECTDYILDYTDNTNKGNGTVRVLFKGDYAGEVDKEFAIKSKALTETDVTVTIGNQTYTGQPLTPNVTVKYGNLTLVKDKDYTITYEDNTKVGTGKAKITFTGNYSGETEGTFQIAQKVTSGGGGGGSSYSYNISIKDSEGKNVSFTRVESGNKITITLNKNKEIKDDSQYTITVTDKKNKPAVDKNIVLKDVKKNEVQGTTDENGVVILPVAKTEPVTPIDTDEDITHEAYVSGYLNGSFGPDNFISRSETTALLYRVLPEWFSQEFTDAETYINEYFNNMDESYLTDLGEGIVEAITDEEAENTDLSYVIDEFTNILDAMISALPFDVSESAQFTDTVEGAWYEEAVEAMSSIGFINGYTDGSFRPDNYITRAEFVTIIMQNEDIPEFDGVPFSDVDADLWSAKYIAAAYKAGLIDGYEDGTFCSDSYITRAEAVKIVNALIGRDDMRNDTVLPFNDVSMTHWAYKQIAEASVSHKVNKSQVTVEDIISE